ncbi:MAG: helix-turn-helix domain-containing protein [Oscillospiraceae bacterium]|nr:helix-turn-helix domain-containing protein [Lachnospiraceae bacterium]MBO7728004.1 helix-turn-helix domain-containing protein [Oscillospiraceae bacterium]
MAKAKYEEWLTDDGLTRITGWARDGLTDEQIAQKMGISRSTLKEWKAKYPAISAALKESKELVDRLVENALLKRALGYEYDEITEELRYDKKAGEMRMTETKRQRKQVAPDTTAQIFWLKNRKPDDWRDKPEPTQDQALQVAVEILGDIGGAIK